MVSKTTNAKDVVANSLSDKKRCSLLMKLKALIKFGPKGTNIFKSDCVEFLVLALLGYKLLHNNNGYKRQGIWDLSERTDCKSQSAFKSLEFKQMNYGHLLARRRMQALDLGSL